MIESANNLRWTRVRFLVLLMLMGTALVLPRQAVADLFCREQPMNLEKRTWLKFGAPNSGEGLAKAQSDDSPESNGWIPLTKFKTSIALERARGRESIWFRIELPAKLPQDPAILTGFHSGTLELQTRGQPFFSFGEFHPGGDPIVPGWLGVLSIIPLPKTVAPSDVVEGRFFSGWVESPFSDRLRLGSMGCLWGGMVRGDFQRFSIGLLLLGFGALQIAVLAAYRQSISYFYSGAFSFSMGNHLLATLGTTSMLLDSPRLLATLDVVFLYAAPFWFLLVTSSVFSLRWPFWKWIARVLQIYSGTFALMVPLFYAFGWLPLYSLHSEFRVGLLVQAVFILSAAARATLDRQPGSRLFLAGFVCLFVAVFLEIFLVDFLGFRNAIYLTHYGLFLLALFPAIVLLRKFAATHRDLLAALFARNEANKKLHGVLVGTRSMGFENDPDEVVAAGMRMLFSPLGVESLVCEVWISPACTSIRMEQSSDEPDALLESGSVVPTNRVRIVRDSFVPLGSYGGLVPLENQSWRRLPSNKVQLSIGVDTIRLAEIVFPIAADFAFTDEFGTFLDSLVTSMGGNLERIRLAEIERQHLLELVTMACDISDKLNSPLTVIGNGLRRAGEMLRGSVEQPATDQGESGRVAFLEKVSRTHEMIRNSVGDLEKVSRELSRFRELISIESTKVISEHWKKRIEN